MASSRREGGWIRASRNAMRDFVAIPYNALGASIPYQACGLDNKKRTFGRQKFLFCCLRTTKRCVKWGKNDKKYTIYFP